VRLFSDVASGVDDPYLAHALSVGARGVGRTWPNPAVGCVIVRDGKIVGEGFHPRAGEAHAEIFALADAGADARGADAYVTLEPCAHHGRTPPCTEALIAAGVRRVIIGMRDPNADAAGGAEKLAAAGIDVAFADDPRPFAEINRGWLKRLATGLPFVTAKSGLSLDGRVAFQAGERASITGAWGADVTRRLRSRADAVMVSAATVTADDPALTVRDSHGPLAEHQPIRVVLVREHVPASDALVFSSGSDATLVLASERADERRLAKLPAHVHVMRWESSDGVLGALACLGKHGVGELLVEPGPRLLSALWDASVVDEYVTVVAGGMVGSGPELFSGTPDREDDALVARLVPVEAGIVGNVVVTVWGADERPDVA
jgi:diaminohydroxyphosphoribosylaminopyrimidine deaminase / 5-amino-6-(5-phosphoribosylamino)uracil reductase